MGVAYLLSQITEAQEGNSILIIFNLNIQGNYAESNLIYRED